MGVSATNGGARRWVERARETIGAAEIAIGVALGCLLAWVSMSFQSLNILGDAGEPVLDTVYLSSITVTAVTILAVGIAHHACAPVVARRGVRWVTAALMTAATAAIPLVGMLAADGSNAGMAAAVACGALSGAASAVFLVQFGILVAKFSAKNAAAIAAIGYLVSSALFCGYSTFGALESCVFAATMPLASAFLREVGAGTPKGRAAIDGEPLPAQALPDDPSERRSLHRLTAVLAACVAGVGCANELARTLYVQMGIAGAGNSEYATVQAAATLVVGVGATALTLVLVSMKTPRAPEYCYRILMLFLTVGVLLLPVPLLYPQVPVVIPYALNAAAYQCFGLLSWVMLCGVCRHYLSACVRTFSLVRAAWSTGPIIGILIGRFVVHGTPFGLSEMFLCALGAAVLIMVAGSVAFTASDLAQAVNMLPTDRRRRFLDKCLAIAERCKLSDREAEIMTLFAKGRNLAYIQEKLCLSKSTVSTHRQHIYQKLGVHSSQEMIDLIQAEKA